MSREHPTIEHNQHEKRAGNGIWWAAWAFVGVLWLGTWFFWGFDWHQIALGAGTGLLLATWALELTGNKTPEWLANSLKTRSPRDR